MDSFVQWNLTKQGYRVVVYDGDCQPIEEYSAGNHPLDSQSVAPPGHEAPTETLIKWAQRTAREMADEHNIPHARVSRDTDAEEED
jgi:hypothetical protein